MGRRSKRRRRGIVDINFIGMLGSDMGFECSMPSSPSKYENFRTIVTTRLKINVIIGSNFSFCVMDRENITDLRSSLV